MPTDGNNVSQEDDPETPLNAFIGIGVIHGGILQKVASGIGGLDSAWKRKMRTVT